MKRAARTRNILLALIVLTGVCILLPPQATSFLKAPIQLLIPAQTAASRMVDGGRRVWAHSDPAEPDQDPAIKFQSLENQLASQQARIESLERQNSALAMYRRELPRGQRLISARAISRDALYWRSSLLLAAGSARGVQSGSAVVTRFFVDAGTEAGLRSGMSVLSGEVLVGFVDQVDGGMARVRLVGDVESRLPVRLGRVDGERVELFQERFWMSGTVEGQPVVGDVEVRFVEENRIGPGDRVMSLDDVRPEFTEADRASCRAAGFCLPIL